MGVLSAWLGAVACTPPVVTSLPPTVRRIAVLPPYKPGAGETRAAPTENDFIPPLGMTVGDVLAQQARIRLVEKGYDVVDLGVVESATKDRMPTSPQMAAKIVRCAP